MSDNNQLLKTPLYEEHEKLKGRIVPFAGYMLPVQFEGIIAEHTAVRQNAGMFDVSHMGEVEFSGKGALEFVNYLCTNDVEAIKNGQVLYTPFCKEDGGILDDCLVYRFSPEKIWVVVNAANHDKMFNYFKSIKNQSCNIVDRSYDIAQIALQGPKAKDIIKALGNDDAFALNSFEFIETKINGSPCILSRTGYTGEDGYEIYSENQYITNIWKDFLTHGKDYGLKPVGLGARDTLRLEAKLCLYGNDINETTTPLEAGIGWTVKFDKKDFVGKTYLLNQKQTGIAKKLTGFKMLDKAVARHDYEIYSKDGLEMLGKVTSGSPSPTLKENIGLGYLPQKYANSGNEILILIRDKKCKAITVKTPFYKKQN